MPRSGWARASSDRRPDHGERNEQRMRPGDLLRRQPLVVACERQNESDLHHFGRLESNLAIAEPALGAAALNPDHHHQGEQDERHEIERIGGLEPPANVGHRDSEEKRKPEAEAHHVTARPRFERAAGDRIERSHADRGDGGDQQEKRPVDAEKLLGELELALLIALLKEHAHCPPPASARAEPASTSLLATKAGRAAGSRSKSSVITSWTIGAAVCAPQPPCSTTQATE